MIFSPVTYVPIIIVLLHEERFFCPFVNSTDSDQLIYSCSLSQSLHFARIDSLESNGGLCNQQYL